MIGEKIPEKSPNFLKTLFFKENERKPQKP